MLMKKLCLEAEVCSEVMILKISKESESKKRVGRVISYIFQMKLK